MRESILQASRLFTTDGVGTSQQSALDGWQSEFGRIIHATDSPSTCILEFGARTGKDLLAWDCNQNTNALEGEPKASLTFQLQLLLLLVNISPERQKQLSLLLDALSSHFPSV